MSGEAASQKIENEADVVVIGGGIVGCATAYNLAKRGMAVVLVEKGEIAGEQSGRNWGWVSQLRNPVEAPLQILSQKIWGGLSEELDADLEWVQAGSFYLAADEEEFETLRRQAEIMRDAGMDVAALSRSEVEEAVPGIAGNWYGGYLNRTNGHADPVKTTTAFARAAQEAGAKIYSSCAAVGVEVSNGAVASVETERGSIKTALVICAAGAWSGRIGRTIGLAFPQMSVRATVARTNPVPHFTKTNVWGGGVAVRQRTDGSLIIAGDGTSDHDVTLDSFRHLAAFLPEYRRSWRDIRLHFGAELVKEAMGAMPWSRGDRHPFTRPEPQPNARKVKSALQCLLSLFPHLDGLVRIEQAWAGYIDGTPDRVPIIGEAPGIKGFIVATGFSGHGFAMGPGAGVVVSELALDGHASVGIHPMRLERFAEGQPNPDPEAV